MRPIIWQGELSARPALLSQSAEDRRLVADDPLTQSKLHRELFSAQAGA